MTDYSISTTLQLPYPDAVARIRTALSGQGFGIVAEIDIAAIMKDKLGKQIPPQLILGACNPRLAHEALTAEPSVGLLLPCNVVVRALDDTTTVVETIDPAVLVSVSGNPALESVADQARERLDAALTDADGSETAQEDTDA